MAALCVHVERAEDPGFVCLRTSASLAKRDELDGVLLMLRDAAEVKATGNERCRNLRERAWSIRPRSAAEGGA